MIKYEVEISKEEAEGADTLRYFFNKMQVKAVSIMFLLCNDKSERIKQNFGTIAKGKLNDNIGGLSSGPLSTVYLFFGNPLMIISSSVGSQMNDEANRKHQTIPYVGNVLISVSSTSLFISINEKLLPLWFLIGWAKR